MWRTLESGNSDQTPDGSETVRYHLGFRLKEPTADGRALLLVGTSEYGKWGLRPQPSEPVTPGQIVAGHVEADWGPFCPQNAGVATAIQCKARGWDDLARSLLAESLKQPVGRDGTAYHQPAGLPPMTALRYVAWAYYGNQLLEPDADRAALAWRMRALLNAEPQLGTDTNRGLLRAVEATIVPSTAPAGSVEAAVDALIDLDYTWLLKHEPDIHYRKVATLGFAAVPALIEHLDDQRLTRDFGTHHPRSETCHQRVGEAAKDLLQNIAAGNLRPEAGQGRVTKAAAVKWWEGARQVGEEAYMTDHMVAANPAGSLPNWAPLWVLTDRYPQRLAEIYRTLPEKRPTMETLFIAKAVADSILPREEKTALFRRAVAGDHQGHRVDGLLQLKDFDAEAFATALVKALDTLPTPLAGRGENALETRYAYLVNRSDDSKAWDALLRAARRSDVDTRAFIIDEMTDKGVGDRQRRMLIGFLLEFFDDDALHTRFLPPSSPDSHPIAIRNVAAMTLASILKLPGLREPGGDWTPEEWAALRARARAAAEAELRGPSGTRPAP